MTMLTIGQECFPPTCDPKLGRDSKPADHFPVRNLIRVKNKLLFQYLMAMDSVPRGLLKRFRAPAPSRRRPEGREMVVFDHDVRLTGSWRRRSWRRGWGTAQPLRARRRKVPKRLRARSSSWGSPICLGRSTSRSTDWPGSSERRIGSRSSPSLNNTCLLSNSYTTCMKIALSYRVQSQLAF